MEIYIARQPIFENNLEIFGYELLYRKSDKNYFEGSSDSQATVEVINNVFINMDFSKLTGNRSAFIKFSKDLIKKETPLLLPKDYVYVGLLNRNDIDEETIQACRKLKEEGYKIVLDSFTFKQSEIEILDIFDIVKIVFSKYDIEGQREFLERNKGRAKFLAEKIETREEYMQAKELGYDYLQGYFFSKPVVLKEKNIEILETSYVEMLSEISKDDPSYDKITEIVKRDIGMSYKILRRANSVFYGARTKIESIKQALVRIGLRELKNWVYVMILNGPKNNENSELIQTCLIRGKFMEILSQKTLNKKNYSEYFITGIFSSIDAILNKDINVILKELLLPEAVSNALLGEDNEISELLKYVLYYEKGDFEQLDNFDILKNVNNEVISQNYINALSWADSINY